MPGLIQQHSQRQKSNLAESVCIITTGTTQALHQPALEFIESIKVALRTIKLIRTLNYAI